MLRSRRRSAYGAYLCAVISALLLLLSVSLLYSRLSLSHPHSTLSPFHLSHSHSLLSDSAADDDDNDGDVSISSADDPIDELDIILDEQQDDDDALALHNNNNNNNHFLKASAYFFDPLTASIRRSFKTPPSSIHQWDAAAADDDKFTLGSATEDRGKAAFGSDDVAVDDVVRRKVTQVTGIEDALLLKSSPLREGWGDWFDKKGVFLRKDLMFRSNFDVLNPLHNPLLQDPDSVGVGVAGLTRVDRIVLRWWMNEFKRVPFPGNKKIILNTKNGNVVDTLKSHRESTSVTKGGGAERRTLNDENGSIKKDINGVRENSGTTNKNKYSREGESVGEKSRPEFLNHIYADGNTWGYYPGLPLRFTFTDFMDAFFRTGKCHMRVFMVWNSPPWMFTVRHQRGLESLLFHHPDACVVVFSETIELDFFKDNFVKDGYKVAVAMPNLDELLKDTPAHIFSSVWFEWRKTKFYSTHYSELIRLAALYKYGGIYLDSDIIVLKPISLLNNSVGLEDQVAGSALNGAVMAFGRHSQFIKKCLEEFYMTYDDTSLRWNGADLLTRVARKFLGEENISIKRLELKVEPSYIFFPINSQNITRYFIAPATETERAQQDVLLEKILHESLTFHFWNSLTSALIPEPDSLVTRLMNYACIRCLELL